MKLPTDNCALISVGSNIEPEHNIACCRKILKTETEFLDESPFIETAPVGFKEQPNFINGAFYIKTSLSLEVFNAYLKSVEDRLGRVKGLIKSGPRTIDLDIVVWNAVVIHEDFHTQDYVATPVKHLMLAHNIYIPACHYSYCN